jgi:type VI secretion system FHA domain protein
MLLTLRVQSRSGQPLGQALSAEFSTAGGTIGRSTSNHLVLEDPGKTVSRTHASIVYRDGHFHLSDMGSNPSMVNERVLGIGKDEPLSNGDRIRIGDYVLDVLIDQEEASAPTLIPQPLPPSTPLSFSQTRPMESRVSMPFPGAETTLPNTLAAERILEGERVPDDGEDFLGLNNYKRPLDGTLRAAESDHVPPQHQAFSVRPRAVVAIPPDYDLVRNRVPTRSEAAQPASGPLAGAASAPPAAAVNRTASATIAVDTLPAPRMPGDARATAAAAAPQYSPTAGSMDSEVLRALLRGMELSDLQLKKSPIESAEQIGAMLREATAGTMAVLLARALTKQESRIGVTFIAKQANNPLKFFPDAGGALAQMLTDRDLGYMNPVQAYAGAFDDLQAHELAVMAGMQSALSSVLARFDPSAIERGMDEAGMLDKLLPAHRKARMWDRMVELYREILRESDHNFQRLFGDRFAEAYKEQIRALRERKQDLS